MIDLRAIMPMEGGGYAVLRLDREKYGPEAGELWWKCIGRFNSLPLNFIQQELPDAIFINVTVEGNIGGVKFYEDQLL